MVVPSVLLILRKFSILLYCCSITVNLEQILTKFVVSFLLPFLFIVVEKRIYDPVQHLWRSLFTSKNFHQSCLAGAETSFWPYKRF